MSHGTQKSEVWEPGDYGLVDVPQQKRRYGPHNERGQKAGGGAWNQKAAGGAGSFSVRPATQQQSALTIPLPPPDRIPIRKPLQAAVQQSCSHFRFPFLQQPADGPMPMPPLVPGRPCSPLMGQKAAEPSRNASTQRPSQTSESRLTQAHRQDSARAFGSEFAAPL